MTTTPLLPIQALAELIRRARARPRMYLDPVSLPALALWLDGAARGADLVSGTEHAGEELRRFSAWLAARLGRYDGYFVALLVERCAGDEEQAFHAFFVEWDAFQAPDD